MVLFNFLCVWQRWLCLDEVLQMPISVPITTEMKGPRVTVSLQACGRRFCLTDLDSSLSSGATVQKGCLVRDNDKRTEVRVMHASLEAEGIVHACAAKSRAKHGDNV